MSRNIMSVACTFCGHPVRHEEAPRPISRDEAGAYYAPGRDGYGFVGMIVANATCAACEAQYLAWIDPSACPGYRLHFDTYERDAVAKHGHYDLSFRSSFNDEPHHSDLPRYEVEQRTTWARKGAWRGERRDPVEVEYGHS